MCSFVKTMEAASHCCLLLSLLCSISPCQGLPALQQRSGELDVDAYIDAMLASLHQVVVDSSLDPMQLPDLQTDLSQTVAFGVTLHGLAKVPNIKLVNCGNSFTIIFSCKMESSPVCPKSRGPATAASPSLTMCWR